jgi:tetratricopeptide (TPR) repeat protein
MAYAKTSLRAEKRALREKMRALGLGYGDIAAEFARRYRSRPRSAWREAYGWSLKETADRINSHCGKVGLDPGAIAGMTAAHLCEYENWPGVGAEPSGRRPTPYLLALLAAVYGCAVTDLIDLADREHLPPADLLILDTYNANRAECTDEPASALRTPQPKASSPATAIASASDTGRGISGLRGDAYKAPLPGAAASGSQRRAYRWIQEPASRESGIEREVLMTAHEASEHAERAERRNIGEATLEQFHADVSRLSHEYMTGEPFQVFLEMRRVRNRMHDALERRLWPRDARELYLMVGCLNGLMASAATNLGYPQAAEELIRSGWAYATVIDHRPLMAWLRLDGAYAAYWSGRPRQSLALAERGLEYLADGHNAAQLHLYRGLAAAHIGDADTARRAIAAAGQARERDHNDELLEIGGEFGFSRAAHHYYAGFTLTGIPGAAADAVTELEEAAELYAAGPGPGEDHSHKCWMLAHTDLATAWLRARQLDAAVTALDPVLALSPGNRTAVLAQRLTALRTELASPHYQGSPQAGELDERIEEFRRETIVTELHTLHGSPA